MSEDQELCLRPVRKYCFRNNVKSRTNAMILHSVYSSVCNIVLGHPSLNFQFAYLARLLSRDQPRHKAYQLQHPLQRRLDFLLGFVSPCIIARANDKGLGLSPGHPYCPTRQSTHKLNMRKRFFSKMFKFKLIQLYVGLK